ncbi:MAG: hypothetical protein ACRDF9_09090, partial [Candidatus Limnocylindria bacterium]
RPRSAAAAPRDLSKRLFSFLVDDPLKRRWGQEAPAAHAPYLGDCASARFQRDAGDPSIDRLTDERTHGDAATFRLGLEALTLDSAKKNRDPLRQHKHMFPPPPRCQADLVMRLRFSR